MKNLTRSLFRISHFAFRIICAVLVMLCACGGKGRGGDVSGNDTSVLADIDSMMWRQPDSAFVMLQAFASSPSSDSLGEFDGHYFHLLLSELLYKNYCSQTNREELLRAAAYFDSLEKEFPFFDARAHYIKGVEHHEKGNVVEACEDYLKALDIMEDNFEEKELVGEKVQFISLIYNHLGVLYSDQYMIEPAIECFLQEYANCLIAPTSTYNESMILCRLGQQYDMLGEKEKAHDYFGKALERLPDHDNLTYRDILSAKALNEYQLGMGREQSLGRLMFALSHAGNEEERLTRCLTIGALYYEEGKFDSAMKYLQPVFEANKDLASSIQAAEYLKNICQAKGDSEKAQRYVSFLSEHTVERFDNMALVTQLEELFDKHLSKQQLRESTKEKKQAVAKTVRTLALVALLVMLPLVLLIIWSKKRRKTLQAETVQLKEQETKTRQTLEAERHAHRIAQTSLSGRLKKSNQEVLQLKKEVSRMREHLQYEVANPVSKTYAERFCDEPVCRDIRARVEEGQFKSKIDFTHYKKYALDKQNLRDLRCAANHHYNHFTTLLKQRYPRLKEKDLDYCCLYLLGLDETDLAALMQCSYNAVIDRKCKLREIFGSEKSIPDFLTTIVRNHRP